MLALRRQQEARRVLAAVVTVREKAGGGFAERLSRAMMNPVTGIPILLIVLYFGFYQFMGVFGAQTLVDFIEGTIFGEWVNPWITSLTVSYIPFEVLQDFFIGKYGIITLGITYAFALILPIVGTFFIVFSIIEDSGYLPRLAMLIDRVFKVIGLNGRAVIPLVLGFGCDTMATIVTKTQETRRERVITTFLLALAIPCSAQPGVIFAILSGNGLTGHLGRGDRAGVFTGRLPGGQGYPREKGQLLYGSAAAAASPALQMYWSRPIPGCNGISARCCRFSFWPAFYSG